MLAGVIAGGCRSSLPPVPALSSAGNARISSPVGGKPEDAATPVEIEYRIDASLLEVPIHASRISAQRVSYEPVSSGTAKSTSLGVLHVRYPHPGGLRQRALATVLVTRKAYSPRPMARIPRQWLDALWPRDDTSPGEPGRAAGDLYEAWSLDIPRTELTALLDRIEQSGFYSAGAEHGEGSTAGVVLRATMGTETHRRKWRPVVALDALMHRVRREGQLIAYQCPTLLPGRITPRSSMLAWRGGTSTAPGAETHVVLASYQPQPFSSLGIFAPGRATGDADRSPRSSPLHRPPDSVQLARLPEVDARQR